MTLLLSVAAVAAGCSSDLDCALSGDCVKGACKCDPGWKTPPLGGTACSAFDLQPALASRPGYRNVSWPSWGGHPVQWRKEDGGDGKWHLFTPQFTNECDVDEWIHNSFIVHAVGEGPRGPWSGGHDVAIPVWAHGSQAVRDPVDGQWLLFFVGGWHYQSDVWQRCNADNATIPWPVEPAGPGEWAAAYKCFSSSYTSLSPASLLRQLQALAPLATAVRSRTPAVGSASPPLHLRSARGRSQR